MFGLKAVIAPHVPNNIGSLSCFDLVTEAGTCVDPIRPSPVTARHVIGQMLADAVFGCLAQALPGNVQAESAGSIWILGCTAPMAACRPETAKAKEFGVINIGLGGIGGRPGKDGLATTAFPSGIGAIPVEVTEAQCPLYFKRKEYLPDSGGAGEWRGGLRQVIEIANREDAPFTISAATFDRIRNPAQGARRRRPGCNGVARLGSGRHPGQGHPRHAEGRQPGGRTAGRRRLRRSQIADTESGRGRCESRTREPRIGKKRIMSWSA